MVNLQGRRVLITGGLGFIGSNLAVACARSGAAVTIYDSLDPTCGGNPANIDEVADLVTVRRDDIRSREAVASAMDGVDLVINCAAYTSHLRSMTEPIAYVEVNCIGLLTLLEAARKLDVQPRFIQVGSSTQIGRASDGAVDEQHAEYPRDVYSATKTAAEKLTLAYGAGHGLPVSIVRLANCYGPRAKLTDPGLGFVNYFVGLALQDKEIPVFGDGSQRRAITYVSDVVDAILRVAVSDGCVNETFFAASDRHYSIREVTEAIIGAVRRGRIRHVPWPKEQSAVEVGDSIIDSGKIARYTGWRASVGLEEGMNLAASYFIPRLREYVD